MSNLLVKIVKTAKKMYSTVVEKSRQAWYNTMRAAAKYIKDNEAIQSVKSDLLLYSDSFYMTAQKRATFDAVAYIKTEAIELGNQFIADVCSSVCTYKKISEKQAYVIAKFLVDNKLSTKIF